MLDKLAKQYLKLADFFIPEEIAADREAVNRARMFLISHTIGPVLGNSVPLALYLLDPTPGIDILWLAVGITGFWIWPFLLRAGVSFDKLVITSVINLNLAIFTSCYFNGGISSPTLPWVLIIPILSFFYIGGEQRLQATLLSIFGISFLTYTAAYFYFAPPMNDIPEYAMMSLGIVSTTATLAYVATMALYYSRIFDAGVELESEVRRRRVASQELRNAVAVADRTGQMKTEFLARMSHELRTPLNAVIGYSLILKEDAEEANDQQMCTDVDKIHDAGQYLLRLINMILDLSKIEAGKMQFNVTKNSLADIIHKAAEGARHQIESNGVQFSISLAPEVGDIETDSERLIQILDAILSNAGEHTKQGTISICCQLNSSAQENDVYSISIEDTGSGIPPERLKTLFQTLTDARDASSSKYGGTGLNLTVTNKMAAAMGCRIGVESTVGKGSNFSIHVPRVWVFKDSAQPIINSNQESAKAA